ncbi:MAG: hypothetical protein HY927_05490 [Elusimicrobia bacterium]|nr:hypothetical protein [Elusimicrobiota bacterium]
MVSSQSGRRSRRWKAMHDLSPRDPHAGALPYGKLNLRRNPFGELEADDWAALALPAVDLDDVARRLREPGFRVQFVGPSGSGKTTHLLALQARLPEARYARCDSGRPLAKAAILLLDEARGFPRGGGSCALGVHEKIAGCAMTVELGAVPLDRLDLIVRSRVERFRRGDGPVPEVCLSRLGALLERHGGDLRLVFAELYEDIQDAAM